ncbi:MAG: hypothetical protein WBB76_04760, partial [Gaiellaceae bacterium]
MRRLGVTFLLLLPLGVLAACGGNKHAHTRPASAVEAASRPAEPSWVHVIVRDGDLSKPVRGALVRVDGRPGRTDRQGVARIKVPSRGRLAVTVASPGYDVYDQRHQFNSRPTVAVRVFQTKLQWTMYGASPTRTQSQPYIQVRPPFRIVWSRAVGALIEFPAVVADEVAFVSNFNG